MWRKEDGKPPLASSEISTGSPISTPSTKSDPAPSKDPVVSAPVSSKASACISQGIRIKGELTGSEDLFIDGKVEGKISMGNASVTVGPNAVVKAEIVSREVVVRGRVEGKLIGTERIQIWHTARIHGDMKAERIAIEEGSEIHGQVEIGHASKGSSDSTNRTNSSKAPAGKSKDAGSGEEKTSSGAAVAGAD